MPVASVAAAYKNESGDLRSFYSGWPRELLERRPVDAASWPGLHEALEVEQSRIGNASPEKGSCYIVTGQQPAIFTGPLYTVYKIATAIRLAHDVSARFGVTCVPVFWQGNDDHDFEEARTATVLTKSHEPLTLTYEPPFDVTGLPMYRIPLDASIHHLVDQVADVTPGSEYREAVRRFLHESIDASTSLADWNARLIARLFAGLGVVVFASESRAARLAARDVFETEIRDPLASSRLVNEAGARLARLHYEQQVSKGETDCGFFIEFDRQRCKVSYRDGAFTVPAKDIRFTQDELLGVLHDEPERFSPNVALRCIVQQRLFPAAAYVAGPGEIAYWGQFKSLFEYYGLPMPIVYPRAQCALTTSKLNKIRGKLGLRDREAVDWTAPGDIVAHALRTAGDNPLLDAFHAGKRAVDGELRALEQRLSKAPVSVSTLTGRVADAFDTYERMLLHADSARYETVRRQVTRLCNTFAPFRRPQERVFTIFSFLFEHGWDLVPRIVRDIDIASFETREIEL